MTSLANDQKGESTSTTSTSMRFSDKPSATKTSATFLPRRLGRASGIKEAAGREILWMQCSSKWLLEWRREWLSKCKVEQHLEMGIRSCSLRSVDLACSFSRLQVDHSDASDRKRSKRELRVAILNELRRLMKTYSRIYGQGHNRNRTLQTSCLANSTKGKTMTSHSSNNSQSDSCK